MPKQSNDNLQKKKKKKLPGRQALIQQPAHHLNGKGQGIHSINLCPYVHM